jgi:hypothetical protein
MEAKDAALEDRVAAWMAAWNQGDGTERRQLIQFAWVEDGRYVDPFVDVTGTEQIAATLGELMALFPGHRVRRTSGIERHFDQVRFSWELVNTENEVVSDGVDIARIDADCRFIHLTGFAGALVPVPLEV